jgi:hypothetical protein
MYPVPLNKHAVGDQKDQHPMAEECVLSEMADTLGECCFSNSSQKTPKSNESHAHQVLEFEVRPWHCRSQHKLHINLVVHTYPWYILESFLLSIPVPILDQSTLFWTLQMLLPVEM